MTKKFYLETFKKCAGSLCFTLLKDDFEQVAGGASSHFVLYFLSNSNMFTAECCFMEI